MAWFATLPPALDATTEDDGGNRAAESSFSVTAADELDLERVRCERRHEETV